jgi:ferredoxin-NADP reductase
MHRQVVPGMEMVISHPLNFFALDGRARKHLMIAGGIGITPFLSQIKHLGQFGGKFELHYAARNAALCAYGADLQAGYGGRVHLYYDDDGQAIALGDLLARQPIGTHLYVCGPKGMIAWVRRTAEAAGWPAQAVHFEEFLAPGSGAIFTAGLAASGKTVTVGTHQSLLEAIEAAGVDAPYLCRGGACGQCETRVISCDGTILHRDHWLSPEEQAAGTKIMPCVSRFEGKSLVLDR